MGENKNNLSQEAYDILLREIMTLELAPNQPVKEVEVSSRLNISRTPVRTAIQKLLSYGFIKQDPIKGNVVADMSVEHFEKIFQVREAFEYSSVIAATKKWETKDLLEIEEKYIHNNEEEMIESTDNVSLFLKDMNFHKSIAKIGGNEILYGGLSIIIDHFFRYNYLANKMKRQFKNRGEHQAILDMIRTRNCFLAENMMRQHLATVKEEIYENLTNIELVKYQDNPQ
ncbi:GntR family transcriptional regulator [Peptoniphilus sp. KCTC 25270]|uniref:GntR family transcriptional regulator n=1 Tax=Peptoniphilus sp. KCTC 25270 TaxID=2897414 RepID=UPI001E4EA513|nr:GntR family transcriptional regulator [Peptoniphilus sp. KCTC 25270]